VTALALPVDVADVKQADCSGDEALRISGRTRMVGRSIKVRQVFVVLRSALGVTIPAGELLRLAAALVDAAHPLKGRDEQQHSDRPAFDQPPLDRAFSDGGWRVMHCESNWAATAYRDDDPGFVVAKGGTVKVLAA
jgi:hypothetical protein